MRGVDGRRPVLITMESAVRVVGEGEPGEEGAPPGDLHCYIAIKAHPIFSRHNNDLVCQLPISFTHACLMSVPDHQFEFHVIRDHSCASSGR